EMRFSRAGGSLHNDRAVGLARAINQPANGVTREAIFRTDDEIAICRAVCGTVLTATVLTGTVLTAVLRRTNRLCGRRGWHRNHKNFVLHRGSVRAKNEVRNWQENEACTPEKTHIFRSPNSIKI